MPFANLTYSLLFYEDTSDRNPQIRLPDISKAIQGVTINHDKSDRITIYPNESKTLAVTSRTLLWDNTTQLEFSHYLTTSDNVRIKYTGTGTNPVFRTKRTIGGSATTTVSISRVTPYVARVSVVGGTAWNTSTVQVNDFLKIEKTTDAFTSPFSETNQNNTFLVQAKGSDYIDFVDNGLCSLDANIVLGASFEMALRVMSQGPVKIGDIIEITSTTLNPSNAGKYEIVDVSTDYLEIVNALGVNETALLGTSSFIVYDYLIGFVHLRSSGQISVRFGGQVEWAKVDKFGAESVFIGSIKTHQIEAKNEGVEPVVISIQTAAVL